MSQPPNNQYCRICKWWFGARNGGTIGECRAEPPKSDDKGDATWPVSKPMDWCRAWEAEQQVGISDKTHEVIMQLKDVLDKWEPKK